MLELINQYRAELDALCRKYQVKTLEVFGSAVDGSFDPARSDLDFLVDYLPMPPSEHAKAYFGLWFALKDLFHREVDLVETPAVDNSYFLQAANQSRTVLYAA